MSAPAVVSFDVAEAVALVAAGRRVVLVLVLALGERAAMMQEQAGEGDAGRLAVFVGDPGDPAAARAAAAMAVDIFGGSSAAADE